MKRQISICIFLSIIVIILTLLYIKSSNESYRTPNSEVPSESEIIINTIIEYDYFAKSEDGRVVIYDAITKEIYMETSILTLLLPEELQVELERGIYFKTSGELFDFLESYSS